MLYSDEKTHAGFKTALDEVCQVVRPFPELSAVKDAMDVYKKRHGKEDQRKQQAGSRSVSLLVKTRQGSIYLESYTSCSLLVSASVRFRGKVEEWGTGFSVLAVQKMERETKNEKWRGKGKTETILSIHSRPFFTRPIFCAVFLCSWTTRKRLLRRLFQLLHRRFPNNSKLQNNFSFNYAATVYIEIIKQVYSQGCH